MTPQPDPPGERLTAIQARWKGVSPATYGTPRDKAFGLALEDIAYLLAEVARLEAMTTPLDRTALLDIALDVHRRVQPLSYRLVHDNAQLVESCFTCRVIVEALTRVAALAALPATPAHDCLCGGDDAASKGLPRLDIVCPRCDAVEGQTNPGAR